MKIYFAGSIRGGREDAAAYRSIIRCLSSYGEVLAEHVGDAALTEAGEDGPDDRYIYERDFAWLLASTIVVAEVSVPSLGVGYEIGRAVAMKKPVLCMYHSGSENRLSAMIAGNPQVETVRYTSTTEANAIIGRFLKERHLVPPG